MKACWPLMGARFISDRRSRQATGAGAFALALFCVLGIALVQRQGGLDMINIRIMTAAGHLREGDGGRLFTPVMLGASAVGGTVGRLALLALVVMGLCRRGRWAQARWLLATALSGMLLNLALKQLFAAPRPDLLPHLDIVDSYSFPSGHAAQNMIFFGALSLLAGMRGGYIAAAVMIALIGVSRVWLGVHWPSDVLAGWVEGLGWLAFCAAWLPARGGKQEGAHQALMRRHSVRGDEAVNPEAVENSDGGDQ